MHMLLTTALHVSGVTITDLQEYKTQENGWRKKLVCYSTILHSALRYVSLFWNILFL